MTEPQPEYVWVFPDEKPKRGRVWLIVVLAVLALALAAAVFWLFIRPTVMDPSHTPAPSTSVSPNASPSASLTPTPSTSSAPTTLPTPTPDPSSDPTIPAPPAPQDPTIATFRDKVSPVLTDAQRGLQIARDSDGQEAAQTIGLLQEDAGRLAMTVAPSSISARWNSALHSYSKALSSLRSAYEREESADREAAAATKAVEALNAVVR